MKYFFSAVVLLCLLPGWSQAQVPIVDTLVVKDSVAVVTLQPYQQHLQRLLQQNRYLNSQAQPIAQPVKFFTRPDKTYLFYLLAGTTLLLALLRFFFTRYFSNLFRVFFNTSLRQSQLTDQLLQARLPSLLFNVFFFISGGFFAYLLLVYYKALPAGESWWLYIPLCIATLAGIYAVKYITLRFTGWITSYKTAVDTYIFIVFLINKIAGILILPLIITMAFADQSIALAASFTAVLTLSLMLVLRLFKSYGLVKGEVKVSRFHFLLYIIGAEILPLALIYKALVIYITKSL